MRMPRRLGAEFFGTFWLTFAGCGSAVAADGAFGSVLMADYELDRLSSGTRSQHD